MSMRTVASLAAFAFRTNARSRLTRAGLVVGAAVVLLGSVLRVHGGDGWGLDTELGFLGYLFGGLFILRSGVEEQRETGLATFLRHNFISPAEHATGAVMALVATWLAYSSLAFLFLLAVSAGDAALAAWKTWIWALYLGFALPFVPMVESAARFRLPLVLPALAAGVLSIALFAMLDEARLVALTTNLPDRGNPASSFPVTAWAVAFLVVGFGLYIAATASTAAMRHRRFGR